MKIALIATAIFMFALAIWQLTNGNYGWVLYDIVNCTVLLVISHVLNLED